MAVPVKVTDLEDPAKIFDSAKVADNWRHVISRDMKQNILRFQVLMFEYTSVERAETGIATSCHELLHVPNYSAFHRNVTLSCENWMFVMIFVYNHPNTGDLSASLFPTRRE